MVTSTSRSLAFAVRRPSLAVPPNRHSSVSRRLRPASQGTTPASGSWIKRCASSAPHAVPTRHNGFEAWRRIAEPVKKDKALVRRDLLPLVTNPRAAPSMDALTKALKDWETNKRFF